MSKNHPAHVACKNGHLKIVKYFIKERNVDPNIQKKNGLTLLMIACMRREPAITECLLMNKADPFITTEKGTNALYLAAKYGCSGSVKLLLDYIINKSMVNGIEDKSKRRAAINCV